MSKDAAKKLYVCNRKRCSNCYSDCNLTSDVRFAATDDTVVIADGITGAWIPCSERLPSEKDYIGDVVIWCTDKSMVGVGWYYESTESWATIDDTFPPILGEVIAWMPLPKPWKGADDE